MQLVSVVGRLSCADVRIEVTRGLAVVTGVGAILTKADMADMVALVGSVNPMAVCYDCEDMAMAITAKQMIDAAAECCLSLGGAVPWPAAYIARPGLARSALLEEARRLAVQHGVRRRLFASPSEAQGWLLQQAQLRREQELWLGSRPSPLGSLP